MTIKSEVADWKRHPISQIFISVFEQRIKDLTEELVWQAKDDQLALAEKAGYIKACMDMLSFEVEEIHDGN